MKPTVRIATIGGVPVGAHWSTLLVLTLFATDLATVELPATSPGESTVAYWVTALVLAAVFLASIVAHELAHAAVARHHGVGVDGITLWLLGGVAQLHGSARDADSELRIALAGPAASFVIGLISGIVAVAFSAIGVAGLLVAAFGWLGVVSVVLAVFNLLPGAPLDGGRVVTALLWRRNGDERTARRQAARIGQALGQVLIGLGILELFFGAGVGGLWFVLLGWFLSSAAQREETDAATRGALAGVRVCQVMTPRPTVVHSGTSIAAFVEQQALHGRGSSFPMVDDAGKLCGMVTLRRIRETPRERWSTTPVDEIAVAPDQLWTAEPQALLLELLTQGHGGNGRMVVLEHDCPVGIVSPLDITQAIQRFSLQADLREQRSVKST
jgi:Zn-dependent protease